VSETVAKNGLSGSSIDRGDGYFVEVPWNGVEGIGLPRVYMAHIDALTDWKSGRCRVMTDAGA
jgi:hypothetical protein